MLEHRLRMLVRILKQAARRASSHYMLPFPSGGVFTFTLRIGACYCQRRNGATYGYRNFDRSSRNAHVSASRSISYETGP